jgi:hypothetical protein
MLTLEDCLYLNRKVRASLGGESQIERREFADLRRQPPAEFYRFKADVAAGKWTATYKHDTHNAGLAETLRLRKQLDQAAADHDLYEAIHG